MWENSNLGFLHGPHYVQSMTSQPWSLFSHYNQLILPSHPLPIFQRKLLIRHSFLAQVPSTIEDDDDVYIIIVVHIFLFTLVEDKQHSQTAYVLIWMSMIIKKCKNWWNSRRSIRSELYVCLARQDWECSIRSYFGFIYKIGIKLQELCALLKLRNFRTLQTLYSQCLSFFLVSTSASGTGIFLRAEKNKIYSHYYSSMTQNTKKFRYWMIIQ